MFAGSGTMRGMSTPGRDQPVGIDEPHIPGAGAKRIAVALGWKKVPELTEEEIREANEQLAEARRRVRDSAA